MANTFKMDTKANLVTDAVTLTTTNVVTAGSSASLILLSVLISNKTGSSANVDVYLVTNVGDDVYLLRNAPIPSGSSLDLIQSNKYVMEPSDVLRARSDTLNALDIAVSYLELV
jgi:hypothetical protein